MLFLPAPGPVSSFGFVGTNKPYEVTVNWTEPIQKNGVIRGYTITYNGIKSVSSIGLGNTIFCMLNSDTLIKKRNNATVCRPVI